MCSFSVLFELFLAVRLGRCPKKDRPAKSTFMYMPQNDTLDLDRQVRTEQMVLTVHDAFRKACQDFDDFSALFLGPEVSYVNPDIFINHTRPFVMILLSKHFGP